MDDYQYVPYKVKYARDVTEPIVKKSLEAKGYLIKESTRDEDFNGIDFTVINTKTHKETIIDAKCSEEKNWNTPNFLFTIKSNYGKYYKDKKTDYVAFINFPTNEIIIIDINKLASLADVAKQRNGNGIYVLLNKNEVKKLGYSIQLIK